MFKAQLINVLKNEKDYRAYPAMHYSRLKWFATKSPLSYRKKYILGSKEDDPDNLGIKSGSLLDVKLLGTEQDFEDRYFIAQVDKAPTPNNLKFCEELMKLTIQNTNEEGIYIGDFSSDFEMAYINAGISTPKLPKFTENFADSETEAYYRQLRLSAGKDVITFKEVEDTDYAAKVLREDETTRNIFNGDGINQLPIVFEYCGEVFKMLLDRLSIDHENKVLKPYDLKSTFDVQGFGYQWFKLRYDLQQALYSKGIECYRDVYYPDYTIDDFKFVCIDIPAYSKPLVFKFEFTNPLEDPWQGFTYKYKTYQGIWSIMEAIHWHEKNDQWKIKKEHFDNKGQVIVQIT